MKKPLIIITVMLILCMCGCSNAPQSYEAPIEAVADETLSIKDSETVSCEPEATETSADADKEETEIITVHSETAVHNVGGNERTYQPKEKTQPAVEQNTNFSFEPVKPAPAPTEPKAPEAAPTTETPKETDVPKETEPPIQPVVTEPEPEPEAPFDIGYWISYAQDVAGSKGLTLDSTAVDCWDNPITANPDCIYLERDINSRMSRYAKDEDVTSVWIWYECVGTNRYLIYIGYA